MWKEKQQIYCYVDQIWNMWVSLEPQYDVLIQQQIEVTSKRLEELFEDKPNFIWDLEISDLKEFEENLKNIQENYPDLFVKIMMIKNMILDL